MRMLSNVRVVVRVSSCTKIRPMISETGVAIRKVVLDLNWMVILGFSSMRKRRFVLSLVPPEYVVHSFVCFGLVCLTKRHIERRSVTRSRVTTNAATLGTRPVWRVQRRHTACNRVVEEKSKGCEYLLRSTSNLSDWASGCTSSSFLRFHASPSTRHSAQSSRARLRRPLPTRSCSIRHPYHDS